VGKLSSLFNFPIDDGAYSAEFGWASSPGSSIGESTGFTPGEFCEKKKQLLK